MEFELFWNLIELYTNFTGEQVWNISSHVAYKYV